MLDSYPITEFYGFTEEEVKQLCRQYTMDYETVKAWYNGYLIDGMHMYNPNSVAIAMDRHRFDSYWKNTSSFETINTFITMNYEGLKDDIMTMLSGGKVYVNTNTFQNDLSVVSQPFEMKRRAEMPEYRTQVANTVNRTSNVSIKGNDRTVSAPDTAMDKKQILPSCG